MSKPKIPLIWLILEFSNISGICITHRLPKNRKMSKKVRSNKEHQKL